MSKPDRGDRYQAYIQLIHALLSCPSVEEVQQVLNANRELVDAGLVQMMRQVAGVLGERGDHLSAEFLTELARLLSENLENLPIQSPGQAEADRLFNLGIQQFQTSQFPAALQSWEKALTIARKIGNRQCEAASLIALGNAYISLGQYPKAIDLYQQSLTIAREIDDRKGEANSLSNLGIAYKNLGQYPKAIELNQQSLTIAREIGDKQCEASSLNNLGLVCQNLGQYPKAIEFNHQSLTIAREIGDRNGEAASIGNLGIAYFSLGQYNKAIEFHQQSLTIQREIGDRNGEAQSLNCLGNAYESLGQDNKAIEFHQQSLTIQREIGDRNGEAQSLNFLGNAYRKLQQIPKAIQNFKNCLKIATPTTMPIQCFGARLNLGYTEFTAGNWELAIESYQIAVEIVEDIRSLSIDENRKQEIIAENIGVFVHIIQCYVQLKQYDKAIEYAERSKTRNLVDLIAIRDLYPKGDIPQETLEELDRLRQEILIEQRKLFNPTQINPSDIRSNLIQVGQSVPTPSPAIPDTTQLNKLKQQLNKLIKDDINSIDPEFEITQKVEPIPFNEIQELADDRTAIIQWYITGEEIFTFITTKNSEQPLVERFTSLDELINQMKDYLVLYVTNKEDWRTQLPSFLRKFAQILHLDEIISPLKENYSQIILIPHLYLHLLPLDALPLADEKCLLDHFEQVQYAPSCQLLQLIKKRQRQESTKLFGIQNPTEDLFYTDIEVENISQIFHPHNDILAKQAATKTALDVKALEKIHYSQMNQKPKTKHLKVYAPNVHLFAFHLAKEEDDQLLWRECQEIFTKFNIESTLNIEERKGYRVDLLKITNPQDILLKLESEITLDNEQLKITGFAYPLPLHDTYILCLNLRRPEKEITSPTEEEKTQPVSLQFFQYLNPDGCFLPQNIGSSLGQTLLLTLWYTPENKWQIWKTTPNLQELRELADQCLENFVNQYSLFPEFNQAGELFNSPIFEYGFPSQREGYCHVLVWIFCEPETDQKFQYTYQNLINLFAYRNKIIQAYQDSRQVYQKIAEEYQNLEPYLDEIFQVMPVKKNLSEAELNQFKQYIKDIPNQHREYSNLIRGLDNYRLTIEINIQNYQRELNNISSQFPGNNISLLETFLQEDCHLFREQLQADLGYFKYGTELLEQALNAIRGRVEIDQADRDRIQQKDKEKSDRQLQITLTAVGAGIAVGGIVASSSGQVTADNPIYFPWQPKASNQLHPFTWFVIVSIVCALIAFILIRWAGVSRNT